MGGSAWDTKWNPEQAGNHMHTCRTKINLLLYSVPTYQEDLRVKINYKVIFVLDRLRLSVCIASDTENLGVSLGKIH